MLFSIALELPGLILAAVIVDRLGRKVSMAALLFLCFVFMLPLVTHQPDGLTTALLFGARACIMGSFTLMFLYAPEVSRYNTIRLAMTIYKHKIKKVVYECFRFFFLLKQVTSLTYLVNADISNGCAEYWCRTREFNG